MCFSDATISFKTNKSGRSRLLCFIHFFFFFFLLIKRCTSGLVICLSFFHFLYHWWWCSGFYFISFFFFWTRSLFQQRMHYKRKKRFKIQWLNHKAICFQVHRFCFQENQFLFIISLPFIFMWFASNFQVFSATSVHTDFFFFFSPKIADVLCTFSLAGWTSEESRVYCFLPRRTIEESNKEDLWRVRVSTRDRKTDVWKKG